MEILENKMGKVNILCPCGRLDAYAAGEVEMKLNELTDNAQVWLVVSLEKLEYISSSGLRVLLATLKKARKQDGDIRLTSLQPSVKEVFDMAGFTPLFRIFDEEEEAVKSYEGI